MSAPEHILVVDDEPGVRELLDTYLSAEGFGVSTAADGDAMRRRLADAALAPVDLVIVDLLLPGEDGLVLTRHLREFHDVAIVIVTGKGDMVDRVVGLEMGADDYVVKPFDLRELLARIKSVLRRVRRPPAAATAADHSVRFAGWRLDLDSRRLQSPQGDEVVLTSGEFALLATFISHPQRVLSRDRLLEILHHRDFAPFNRSIDMQVGRLRRKLEADGRRPALIRTVRGAGYLFAAAVERR
ncbi:MAG: response regulator [Pseudomonadota bacterium]|nr:response regulator [Pseudomonadota bacterium]